jgi:subtilisin-like proprotein convertase family protein
MKQKLYPILERKVVLRTLLSILLFVTFNFTVNAQSSLIIGGTGNNSGTTNPGPTDAYFNFFRYQVVYTAAELSAGGLTAGGSITALGFSVNNVSSIGALQNYTIRMGHTTAIDGSATITSTLTEVRSAAAYTPVVQTATSYHMITFNTSFVWNGIDNIVVDICTGSNATAASGPYGSVRGTNVANGSRYVRCSGCGSQCNVAASSINPHRPSIKFNYTNPAACTGSPVPGNTISTANAVCPGATFTLSLQNIVAAPGISYQWQSSLVSTFASPTNLGTGPTIDLTQTVATYYRCLVTCSNSATTVASTALRITISNNCRCLAYCDPTFSVGSGSGDYISLVQLNPGLLINNSTGALGSPYTRLYTSPSPTILQGNTYTLTLSAGTYTDNDFKAWIDFNQSGTFTSIELLGVAHSVGAAPATTSFTFTVPATATIGSTRLRVIEAFAPVAFANCSAYDYGESEDYCINIAAPPPCTGTPAPGNTLTDRNQACATDSITLTLQSPPSGGLLTYQWQVAPDVSGVPGTFVNTGTSVESFITAQAVTSWYRCIVTCGATTNSGTSNPVKVLQTQCYCIPALANGCTTFDEAITNVLFSNINNSSGCSASGYRNYSATVNCASVNESSNVPITVTYGDATYSEHVYVYIDYNDNGVFTDAGELELNTTIPAGSSTATGTISIPACISGNKIMRVRLEYNATTDPCSDIGGGTGGGGETEDYCVYINSVTPVPAVAKNISGPTTATCGVAQTYTIASGSSGTRQWQLATTAGGPYSNVSGATGINQSFTPPAPGTYYLRVRFSGTGCTPNVFSNVLTIVVSGPTVTLTTSTPSNNICRGTAVTITASGSGPYSWSSGQATQSITVTPMVTTAYTVTTGTGVCTGSNTASINIIGGPIASATITPATIKCPGTSRQLSANLVNGISNLTTFSGAAIAISGTILQSGNSNPYPSNLAVSGLVTGASVESVKINNIQHTFAPDVDIVLVSPSGQAMILLADVGNGNTFDSPKTLVIKNGASSMPSNNFASGTYAPTNSGSWSGGSPPAGPYGLNLGNYTGSMNGTWKLYVYDDDFGDNGTIGSWSITFNNGLIPFTYNGSVTYSWTGSNGFTSTLANPVVAPTANTTYTLTVADNSCSSSSAVSAAVLPQPLISTSTLTPYCEGDNIQFNTNGSAFGSAASLLLEINSAVLLDETSWQILNSSNVVIASGGNYSSGSNNITINPLPSDYPITFYIETEGDFNDNIANFELTCSVGNTVLISGTLDGGLNYTTPPYSCLNPSPTVSYSWTGPNGFTSTQEDPSISSTTIVNSGNYVVRITDGNGCTNQYTSNVVVNANPSAALTISPASCPGFNDGSVVIDVNNSDQNLSYFITDDVGNMDFVNPTIFTGYYAGPYTYLIQDQNSCSSSGSFVIPTAPNAAPSISCPGNMNVGSSTSLCGAIVNYTTPVGTDDCPGESTVQTSGFASGSVFPIGSTVNTFVITDALGLTATCSFTVTVQDNLAPTVVCQNVTVQLNASGTASVTATQVNNGSTDNCAIQSMSVSPNTFTCVNVGANTVTLTVTDVNGNSSSCNATVTVQDNVAPTAVCQNVTVQLNAAGTASITAAQINNGSTDNCAIASMSVSPNTFTCANIGGIVSNCPMDANYIDSPTNANSGPNGQTFIALTSGSLEKIDVVSAGTIQLKLRTYVSNNLVDAFTGTVLATSNSVNGSGNYPGYTTFLFPTPPVLVAGQQYIFEIIGSGVAYHHIPGGYALGTAVSPTNPGFTRDIPFKAYICQGVNQVTLTVTDVNGNSSSCIASVTVQDNIAPVVQCKSATVALNASGTGSITPSDVYLSGSDNCGTVNLVSVTPNSFTCANIGANTVTLTVNDGHGNISTCTATVTVQDNVAPTAVCQNVTVQLNAAGTASITAAQINNGSTDNCAIASMSVSPNTFTCANVGANTVTLTVTDVNGNSSSCTATITVQDNVAPTAVCQNVTVQLNAAGTASVTAAQVNNGSTDNCAIQSMSVSPNTFTCANVGANTVTLTVTDVNGNSSSCTATVTVQDNVAPTAVCQNVTVQLNAAGTASVTTAQVNNGSSDNCAIQSMSVSPNTFACANVGANTVTLTVTDVNGNSSSCTATVTVQDNVAPIAVCQNVTVQLNAAGTASVTAAQVNNGSTDNCAIQSMSVSPNAFTCANVGANTVTLTVMDVNGNSSSCTSTVTVQDNIVPTAVCQNVTVQLNAAGSASITTAQVNNGSTDNCAIQSMSVSPSTFTCANVGANTVTLTVTDVNGNASSCTATVTVQDNVAPTAVCQNVIVQLNAAGTTSVTAAQVNNGSTDNCAIQSMSVSPNTFTCANVGANTVTLTVTDVNGNSSSCTATVTVQDNVAPTAVCQNVTVQLNAAGTASVTAAQVNNGSTDNCAIQSISVAPNSFSCTNLGANTVTLTVTDVNGNVSTCNATVTVQDNIAPLISCPGNISLNSTPGVCGAVATYAAPTASDNCSFTVTQTNGLASGSVFPVGTTTNIFLVTDAGGNTASCSFNVTVTDNVAPVVSNCPSSFSACNPITWTPASFTDNCAGVQVVSSHTPGTIFPPGTTTVTYTATDVYNNQTTCSFNVTVVTPSVAADTITSNRDYNNICLGENITLTIGGGILGQGGQWKWYTGSCGGTQVGTGNTLTVNPTVTTTYYVRAQGQCNTTACKSITVVVSSSSSFVNPVITSAPAYGAPGTTGTVTCNLVPGATFYRWTSNYGQINGLQFNGLVGPVESTIPSVQVTFVLPQSNYQIRLVVGNACGRSNTASEQIRGTVGAATSLTGPTQVCPLQTASYTVSAIPDASSYNWVLIPANAGTISGTGLTRSITFAAGFTSAQLCVNGVSTFGLAGPAYCINISTSAPAPGLISGNAQPCSGGSATYTIQPVAGATGYNWSTTVAGATVNASGTSATVTYPVGTFSGNVCVTSNSTCGVSAPSCLAVTSGAPGTPGPITGPVQGICNANGVNFSLATSNAISYSWTTPTGVTVASGGASNSVNLNFGAGFTTGTITVTATYSCGSASSSITVNGAPSVPSVTPTTICPGGDAVYFASSVGGSIYDWTISGADYDNCTNPPSCSQYYIYWSVNGGSFSVTSSNSCGISAPLSVSTNCRISSGTEPIDSKVYPNPTSGITTLEFTSMTTSNFELKLTDLAERTMSVENVVGHEGINKHEIDMSTYNKGIYMLFLNSNGSTQVLKIVLQ